MRSPAGPTRAALAVVVALLALMAAPGVAQAHTDFDFSLPTDGASVGTPIGEVTVAFTSPVTLVGNGFEALDPQGNVLQPFAVTDDDQVFRLQFDPPLAGGAVGVRYEVRADDGHVLAGSFAFTVDAPVPTTAPPTTAPATTAPPTTVAVTTVPAATVASADQAVSDTSVAPVEAAAAPPVDESAVGEEPGAGSAAIAGDDDDSIVGLILVIVAALVVGAAGFFLIRSRTTT